MLTAHGLRKSYGGVLALHDLSVTIRPGQTVGLLGPNGSGKSTTINMLTGLIRPSSGTVSWQGAEHPRRPRRLPVDPRLRPRGAAALRLPLGAGVPAPGRRTARHRTERAEPAHRSVSRAVRARERSLRAAVVVLQGHAAEGADRRGAPARPHGGRPRRAVLGTRRRLDPDAPQPGAARWPTPARRSSTARTSSTWSRTYAATRRGLPIADVERVLFISTIDAAGQDRPLSYLDFVDLARGQRTFAALAAYTPAPMTVGARGDVPDRVEGVYASAAGFAVANVGAIAGRVLEPDDDRLGAPATAVLTERIWRGPFAGDPGIIGRQVMVNGSPATVLGVIPDRSGYPSTAAVFLPLAARPQLAASGRGDRVLRVFGRLAPGSEPAAAVADLAAVSERLSRSASRTLTRARGSTPCRSTRGCSRISPAGCRS